MKQLPDMRVNSAKNTIEINNSCLACHIYGGKVSTAKRSISIVTEWNKQGVNTEARNIYMEEIKSIDSSLYETVKDLCAILKAMNLVAV